MGTLLRACAVAACLVLVQVPPVHAVGALLRVDQVEPPVNQPPDSAAVKVATVTCPAGRKVYSASASILGGGGFVTIESMEPNATLTSVTAKAHERGVFASDWRLQATAICGAPVVNLHVVPQTTPSNSVSPKNVNHVPGGHRAVRHRCDDQ